MKFETENLLSLDELKIIIRSMLPNEKATIISKHLSNVFIISDNILYKYNKDNVTFEPYTNEIKEHIIVSTALLIEQSFLAMDVKDREIITLQHEKYFKVFDKATIDKYVFQLKVLLTNDVLKFDNYVKQLHFKNGYIDVSTGHFEPRVKEQYITKYINGYDYKPSSANQRNQVKRMLNQIYQNNKDDRDCMLSYLGSGLSGEGIKDQDLLFLLGKGASAKSFIMLLTKEALEFYFVELQSDAFKMGNDKKDKIMNTFLNNEHVLITWVNELSHDKIDGDLFKKFAEGTIQCCKLYQDGSFDFKHHSKTIATTQRIPNLNIDSGIIRRLLGYEHKSKFVDEDKEVNELNHVYKKTKDLHLEMKKNGLICAWLDILIEKCTLYLKGENIVYTNHFTEAKNEIVNTNDTFQDFIDGCLIITNNADDRIGKDKMKEAYLQKYKDKMINSTNFISLLKEKKIVYETDYRVNNIKGCFVGVKFRNANEQCLFDHDDYDNGIDKTSKSVTVPIEDHTSLNSRYKYLQEDYEELQCDYDNLVKYIQRLEKRIDVIENSNEQVDDEVEDDSIKCVANEAIDDVLSKISFEDL